MKRKNIQIVRTFGFLVSPLSLLLAGVAGFSASPAAAQTPNPTFAGHIDSGGDPEVADACLRSFAAALRESGLSETRSTSAQTALAACTDASTDGLPLDTCDLSSVADGVDYAVLVDAAQMQGDWQFYVHVFNPMLSSVVWRRGFLSMAPDGVEAATYECAALAADFVAQQRLAQPVQAVSAVPSAAAQPTLIDAPENTNEPVNAASEELLHGTWKVDMDAVAAEEEQGMSQEEIAMMRSLMRQVDIILQFNADGTASMSVAGTGRDETKSGVWVALSAEGNALTFTFTEIEEAGTSREALQFTATFMDSNNVILSKESDADTMPLVRQVAVDGHCEREQIRQVVATQNSGIRPCYETELAHDPAFSGRVTANWVIGSGGLVVAGAIEPESIGSPEFQACVLAEIQRMQFDDPDGGLCRVRFPFEFQLQE